MLILPIILARGHYAPFQPPDEKDFLPVSPAWGLAGVAALMAAALFAPISFYHFYVDATVPLKKLLKNLGQNKMSRLLNTAPRDWTISTVVTCRLTMFRITMTSSLVALLPLLVPLSNGGVVAAVSVALPIGLTTAIVVSAHHWRGRQHEPTEEEIAAYTWFQAFKYYEAQFPSKCLEQIGMVYLCETFGCYATIRMLGVACPMLAHQVFALTSGWLVVIAMSLVPPLATTWMFLCFKIISWVQLVLATKHPQCPASYWPWINVALGAVPVAMVILCNFWKLPVNPVQKRYGPASEEDALC
jgi:hypothetical protein